MKVVLSFRIVSLFLQSTPTSLFLYIDSTDLVGSALLRVGLLHLDICRDSAPDPSVGKLVLSDSEPSFSRLAAGREIPA